MSDMSEYIIDEIKVIPLSKERDNVWCAFRCTRRHENAYEDPAKRLLGIYINKGSALEKCREEKLRLGDKITTESITWFVKEYLVEESTYLGI